MNKLKVFVYSYYSFYLGALSFLAKLITLKKQKVFSKTILLLLLYNKGKNKNFFSTNKFGYKKFKKIY